MVKSRGVTSGSPFSLSSGVHAALPISNRGSALLQTVLFVGPVATSASPPLASFFFASLSILLVGMAWWRGMRWRDLLPPTPAISVALLLAAYVFVNATWSADPTMGLRK